MKIKLAPLFLLFAMTTAQAESLVDGSIDDGKAKALTCTACHGPEGNSSSALWPNIAGQHASYTVAQLQAFKDGTRKDQQDPRQDPARKLLPPARRRANRRSPRLRLCESGGPHARALGGPDGRLF